MRENQTSKKPLAVVAVGGTLLALALLLAAGRPALADLPPRPTAEATEEPEEQSAPDGGRLALEAQFSSGWPWDATHWQDVWTLVQWQDASGAWHDVTGWQGTLDDVMIVDGVITGHKIWWVGADDLGTGPFRWMVYQGQSGARLGTSEPFHLPAFAGETVRVDVSLAR